MADAAHTAEVVPTVLYPGVHPRKPRRKEQDAAIDRAKVQALAGKHVPEAIKTIVDLMRTAKREATKLKASMVVIDLAVGDADSEATTQTKVYVLSADPVAAQTAAEEARRRLQAGK